MQKWLLIFLLAGAAPQLGCGSSDNNTTNSENADTAESTVVRGRLTAEAAGSAGVEGRIVTARRVSEDGQIGDVEAETATDRDGRFTLAIVDDLTTDDTVVLDAYEDNDLVGRVLLMGGMFDSNNVDAPPITLQSTAETNVRITTRAEGLSCDACTAASLEHRIGSSVAVTLDRLSADEGSPYAEFAESLYAGLDAHDAMLRNDATESTSEEVDEARVGSTQAYLGLQTELAESTSDVQILDAQDAYTEAYLQAFLDAGISRQDLAIAAHAEAIARDAKDVTDDPDGEASLLADVELRRAERVTAAIETTFELYGDSTQRIETAGNELQVSIGQASIAGTAAQSDIDDAWGAYAGIVEAELDAQLDAGQLDVFDGLDDAFDIGADAFVDAVTDLETAGDFAARVGGSVTAVAALHEQVVNDDNIAQLTEAGLDEATARAHLEVLFHLRAVSTLEAS